MQGSHPCSSSPFGGEGVTPSWAGTSAELEFRLRFPAAEWLSSGTELGTKLAAGKRSPSKRSGERRSPRMQEMFSESFPPLSPQTLSHYLTGKPFCRAGKSSAAVETESAFTRKIPRSGGGWRWGHFPSSLQPAGTTTRNLW